MTHTIGTPSIESDEDEDGSSAKTSTDPLLRKLEEVAAKFIARDLQRQIEKDAAAIDTPIEPTDQSLSIAPRFGQSTHTRMAAIERAIRLHLAL